MQFHMHLYQDLLQQLEDEQRSILQLIDIGFQYHRKFLFQLEQSS